MTTFHTQNAPLHADSGRVAPVSLGQRRLWFVDRLVPGGVDYSVVWPLRLTGDLDVGRLRAAVATIVDRHEVLRSRFVGIDGEPVMVVDPANASADVPVVDIAPGEVPVWIRRAGDVPFDLATGPVVRWVVLRVSAQEHILLFSAHHIVFDGWSGAVLLSELADAYEGVVLEPLPVQFADYAVWERQWLTGDVLSGQLSYWHDRLTGASPVLDLPTDVPRGTVRAGGGARRPVRIPARLVDALERLCRAEGATTFMGLLAGLNVVLGRYANTDDVLVGTFVAGRGQPELERLIGFFVNTVVLRTDLSGRPSFRTVLGRGRETALGAFAHGELPFDRVVEELAPAREPGVTPYVQVAVVMQNTPDEVTRFGGVEVESLSGESRAAAFDLSIHVHPDGSGGLTGFCEYATDLWQAATVDRLIGHLISVLDHAVRHPDQSIDTIPLATAAEHHHLLTVAVDHERPAAPGGRCLHELFEDQVARRPDAVAASYAGSAVTYAELDARATALAARLQAFGIDVEELVGVCVERSIDSVASVLAVLKAGGAYLPLEPDNPVDRLHYMVEHAGARVVLTTTALEHLVPDGISTILVDQPFEAVFEARPGVTPDHLAYVIYTSGSTGRPKGVAVPHRAAATRVHRPSYVEITEDDVMLHALPMSFDVSVLEVFGALTNGAQLAILPGKALPERVDAFLPAAGVTIGWLTAALFHAVVDQAGPSLGGLRTLIAGGDQLSTSHVERALAELAPDAVLVNGYGPTEAAIFASSHTMDRVTGVDGRVPIGGPIPDTELFVFDRNGHLAPVGTAGELYIGGDCLARGYLNWPARTAERFVPHPFEPGARLYRTGDVVRWRADGRIEFLGRVDHQVKVRGFRVELGEIEQVLRRHPDIGDAVVVARADNHGDKVLVAYLERLPGAPAATADLLEYTRDRLPTYMVPAAFVVLDALPINPNGKVDRAKLPEPAGLRPDMAGYVGPRNAREEVLAALWADLLGLDRVGVHDNFFDLGGHSLLASRLIARVRRTFDRELPFTTFFAAPTVAGLAAALDALLRTGGVARPSVTAGARPEPLPVSLGQRRLWLVDRLTPGGSEYTMVWPLRLTGDLDVDALRSAVATVVGRHEALRTRFVGVDGEPVMVIDPPASFPGLDVVDVSVAEVSAWVQRAIEEPFDLAAGPVARWVLLRVSPVEHVLLFAAHHIVYDGWSGSVLLKEISAAYRGELLDPLPVQFADYAVWERQWLSGEVLSGQIDYWRDRLAGAAPVLDLPTDEPRTPVRSGGGARRPVNLPARLVDGLATVCRAEGATVFMGLVAALDVVLGRYANTDDVLVGTFVAGRGQPELERLVGFFVNTVVLRTDLGGRPSFRTVVERTRDSALGAFAHGELPFDRVVEELAPAREAGVTPYVQVAMVMQNMPSEATRIGDLVVESLPGDSRAAAFDLSIHVYQEPDGSLNGFCEYATDLWHAPTVDRLIDHLVAVVEQAVAHPSLPIDSISLTGAASDVGAELDFGDLTVAERFDALARTVPDAPAFLDGDRTLTYADLARAADRIAGCLYGIAPEEPVGVCLERGLDLPAAALGVWRAGGAYLPLDPEIPADRLHLMLADAGARIVVTTRKLQYLVPPGVIAVVLENIDRSPATGPVPPGLRSAGSAATGATREGGTTEAPWPAPAEAGASSRDALAAVIYTSGSTGRPKGVAVTGRSLGNRIDWFAAECPPRPGDVGVLKTPIGFVDSLWELLGGLLHGVPTVVVPTDAGRDPRALVRILGDHGVTRMVLVPSLMRMLLTVDDLDSRLPSLRLWVSSGEPLPTDLARRFIERMPGRALHNLYGSAEAWDTVWPQAFDPSAVAVAGSVPVGRPIANVCALVLDRAGHPAPVGVTGDLYVGGDCLGRGYLNRPDLTAERFVPHPTEPGARIYRTGDRARYLPDGQLDIVGRADHQLKIRGYRVEPAEVERALEALPLVGQAAVVGWRPSLMEAVELAAYVVPVNGHAPDGAELRTALTGRLPGHLVPTTVTVLAAMPTTATGKVDRAALPQPVRTAAGSGGAATTTGERTIAGLWAELLDVPGVGVDDDFFDIGGHSLIAARMADRLGKLFDREVPVRFVFDHSTVRRMSRALLTHEGDA